MRPKSRKEAPKHPHLALKKPDTAMDLYTALEEVGFFGLWQDRSKTEDTSEEARQLRRATEVRPTSA